MARLPYPYPARRPWARQAEVPQPGADLPGTVEAVGSNVTGFEPGDDVFGICARSFAEYVGVGTDKLAPKPSNLSFKEAAAVPISGLTALRPCATIGGAAENAADLVALRELIEAGQVTPAIDRTYPLSDVATAIRDLIDGHARGKIVITMGGPPGNYE